MLLPSTESSQLCTVVWFIMVTEVCQDWCSSVFCLHNIYHSWLWLNCFHGGIFDNLKNASGGSTAFLPAALASSSASMFFALSMCWTVNPLKKPSIPRTVARYLSSVLSLAMHSFSIWPAITLESVFRTQRWTPIAHNLRSPNSTASYLSILLLHLSASMVNCSRATYLNLIPEGDFNIVVAPAPETSQAPSQYTCHGVSTTVPSV
jgi:hypothetical protein